MIPFMRYVAVVSIAAVATWATPAPPGLEQNGQWPIAITSIDSPAKADSAQPQLTTSKRGVLMSWIERTGPDATLKFAERTGTGWTPATTVASGRDWFVNWADVPSVMRLDDGTLVAHWLQKSGADTYAYDVRLSRSTDNGKTWTPSFTPHSDGTKTEHGFATLFQMPRAGLGLVWLDGRNMKAGGHDGHGGGDMTLRFGSYGKDWKQTSEVELDARVCECCPTAAALTSDGPIVAYRNRDPEEVRDIHVARMENGKWSESKPVHADGWSVPACPVNGPSLSARGRQVALAWFHAKDNQPRAFAALSSDAGRSFGAPIRLDDDASLGRVDIELLPDGTALAAYMEFAEQRAQFRVRRIRPDGSKSTPVTIAGVANARSSGYPRMALHGDELVFAWTARGGAASEVMSGVAPIPR
jgi:hypothetical protein